MNFDLRGTISKKEGIALEFGGLFGFLLIWQFFAMRVGSVAILPSPLQVMGCFPELHFTDFLVRNVMFSLSLNLMAYAEAILISIPVGFVLALYTPIGALVKRYVDAIRYIPLTAVTGLFIAWLGISMNMKVQFLAFGIFVYLLPIVIQRVKDVEEVYIQTAQTLGASKWQIIWKVFRPAVLSKVSDDILVITAISWTYIIVAELINNEGGIGALIFRSARQSRLDKVFACLFVIIVIGILQDKLFTFIDKKIFKHKYIQQGNK